MGDGACPKIRYVSKRAAKRAVKSIGDSGLRPYRCRTCLGNPWHVGHLPFAVRSGETTRGEHYADDA